MFDMWHAGMWRLRHLDTGIWPHDMQLHVILDKIVKYDILAPGPLELDAINITNAGFIA